MSTELRGILAAVPTPLTPDASAVDETTLRDFVDWIVGAGVHGMVPTGTTGEFMTLTPAEHRRVIEAYVEAAAGRVPVVAGVGALATADAIALAQHAEEAGASAVMIVPPFYGPLDFETLKAFMTDVSDAIGIPIVYYNVPDATGIRLDANQIAELGEIENVKYLKDTSGDAVTLTDLLFSRTDKIKAFNGWDTLTFLGIASGAEASVWGAASVVPEQAAELWALCDFLESVNYIAAIKAGAELVGHPVGPARLPVQPLTGEQRARLAELIRATGASTPGE